MVFKSGNCTVRIVWSDRGKVWRAVVRWPVNAGTQWARTESYRVAIGRAPASRLAVDCEEEMRSAAHAALSFADDEVGDIPAAHNAELTGWEITRIDRATDDD